MLRSASCLARSACAETVFATTSRPLVSLSSRCTMPARGTAASAAACASSAFSSVRSGWPARDAPAPGDLVGPGQALAVDGDVPGLEPGLQPVAGILGKEPCQRLVEAQPAERRRHLLIHGGGEGCIPVAVIIFLPHALS